jgi:hypothetical protein
MQGCGRLFGSLLVGSYGRRFDWMLVGAVLARRDLLSGLGGMLVLVAADGGVGGCDPCWWYWCERGVLRRAGRYGSA